MSKSRKASKRWGSAKSRVTKNFNLEALESREMFAADLLADPGQVLSANLADEPVAAVSSATAGAGETGDVGGVANAMRPIGPQLPPTGPLDPLPPIDPLPPLPDPPLPPPSELSAVFENGVVTVTGSHLADNLLIHVEDGMLHVREVVKELDLLSVPESEVSHIVVNAHAGDDWVMIDEESVNIPATLRGEWGNDKLHGGAAGDNLYGGVGEDELLGHGGNDLIEGGDQNDLLIGGDGVDIIRGDGGDDYLLGGEGNDLMDGGWGSDQMYGEGGNDFMVGGSGQDLMDGGDGNDYIDGGDGIDAIYGGEGGDIIKGGEGDDRLRGEGGNDDIQGGSGSDAIEGGTGDDYIDGGDGNDAILGGEGGDTIYGGNDQDWIAGEEGNDFLSGNNGNDMLMGNEGADILDGGPGDDIVSQDEPEGYLQYSTTTQALGWGDVGDFFGDVWDGIVDFFSWTLDKIETIGMRVYEWASQIDDRIYRLGSDLVGGLIDTFSNWPWEADFWKGLGRTVLDTVVDALDLVGLGEIWEIAFEILKPWQRGMTDAEISLARTVFGDSIRYDRVRLDEHSLMAWIGRTHVTGYLINSTEDLDDPTLIHELTHVWQYEQDGLIYIADALGAQAADGEDAYNYGGVAGLETAIANGDGLTSFNPEQQGKIIQDYFNKIQAARATEANGATVSQRDRDVLDVYIHFVKEVSSLTHEQLDVADPVGSPGSPRVLPAGMTATAVGDFNGDRVVNAADNIAWRNARGRTVTPFTSADANGDGLVDEADRQVWKSNFGQHIRLTPTLPDFRVVDSPILISRLSQDMMFADLATAPAPSDAVSNELAESLAASAASDEGLLLLDPSRSANGSKSMSEEATGKQKLAAVTPLALDLALASSF